MSTVVEWAASFGRAKRSRVAGSSCAWAYDLQMISKLDNLEVDQNIAGLENSTGGEAALKRSRSHM